METIQISIEFFSMDTCVMCVYNSMKLLIYSQCGHVLFSYRDLQTSDPLFDLFQSFLAHDLGLSHPFAFVKYFMPWNDIESAQSSPGVRVRDTSFAGVHARVFETTLAGHLKRGVVYFHGGGWTLGSASRWRRKQYNLYNVQNVRWSVVWSVESLFLLQEMKSYDSQCRRMAEELDAVVISVE